MTPETRFLIVLAALACYVLLAFVLGNLHNKPKEDTMTNDDKTTYRPPNFYKPLRPADQPSPAPLPVSPAPTQRRSIPKVAALLALWMPSFWLPLLFVVVSPIYNAVQEATFAAWVARCVPEMLLFVVMAGAGWFFQWVTLMPITWGVLKLSRVGVAVVAVALLLAPAASAGNEAAVSAATHYSGTIADACFDGAVRWTVPPKSDDNNKAIAVFASDAKPRNPRKCIGRSLSRLTTDQGWRQVADDLGVKSRARWYTVVADVETVVTVAYWWGDSGFTVSVQTARYGGAK